MKLIHDFNNQNLWIFIYTKNYDEINDYYYKAMYGSIGNYYTIVQRNNIE